MMDNHDRGEEDEKKMDMVEWDVNDDILDPCKGNKKKGQKYGKWSKEEDEMLQKAYVILNTNGYPKKQIWKSIVDVFEGTRNRVQCRRRLRDLLSFRDKYVRWNDEEDFELLEHVKKNGEEEWNQADVTFGRISGAARKRWNRLKLKANVEPGIPFQDVITKVESFLHK